MRFVTEEQFEEIIQKHGAYGSAEDAIRDLIVFLHGQVESLTATMDVAVKTIERGRFGEPTAEDKRRLEKMKRILTAMTQNTSRN